jgi:hypothetical protein
LLCYGVDASILHLTATGIRILGYIALWHHDCKVKKNGIHWQVEQAETV